MAKRESTFVSLKYCPFQLGQPTEKIEGYRGRGREDGMERRREGEKRGDSEETTEEMAFSAVLTDHCCNTTAPLSSIKSIVYLFIFIFASFIAYSLIQHNGIYCCLYLR